MVEPNETGKTVSTRAAVRWSAPECMRQNETEREYSTKSDVYSFGITCWEILYQSLPFKEIKDPIKAMKYVLEEGGRPIIKRDTFRPPANGRILLSTQIELWLNDLMA